MNLKIVFIALIIMATMPLIEANYAFARTGKVTIKVIDDDGLTVNSAHVGIGFEYNGISGTKDLDIKGTTNADGLFEASATTNGHIGWTITKPGYYKTRGVYDFKGGDFERWEPWNPIIKVLLRKIGNPVPMYARDAYISKIIVPVLNKNIGFDLIKFDWVSPYGRGESSDFIFHVIKTRVVSWKNFDETLIVKFNNKNDGIQIYYDNLKKGSLFRLPRYAPLTGYKNILKLKEWRNLGDYTISRNFNFAAKNINYIFRVRSFKKNGEQIKAMYGKILGPLYFDTVHSKTASITFKYYLNPNYTRNLESDPKRNLFKNLRDSEQVTEP